MPGKRRKGLDRRHNGTMPSNLQDRDTQDSLQAWENSTLVAARKAARAARKAVQSAQRHEPEILLERQVKLLSSVNNFLTQKVSPLKDADKVARLLENVNQFAADLMAHNAQAAEGEHIELPDVFEKIHGKLAQLAQKAQREIALQQEILYAQLPNFLRINTPGSIDVPDALEGTVFSSRYTKGAAEEFVAYYAQIQKNIQQYNSVYGAQGAELLQMDPRFPIHQMARFLGYQANRMACDMGRQILENREDLLRDAHNIVKDMQENAPDMFCRAQQFVADPLKRMILLKAEGELQQALHNAQTSQEKAHILRDIDIFIKTVGVFNRAVGDDQKIKAPQGFAAAVQDARKEVASEKATSNWSRGIAATIHTVQHSSLMRHQFLGTVNGAIKAHNHGRKLLEAFAQSGEKPTLDSRSMYLRTGNVFSPQVQATYAQGGLAQMARLSGKGSNPVGANSGSGGLKPENGPDITPPV